MRGVTQQVVIAGFKGLFQPALPMRGVTRRTAITRLRYRISTRTPHAGSDLECAAFLQPYVGISTRTPHAGSDLAAAMLANPIIISTRTPHAGSDFPVTVWRHAADISTRTPHAGSDAFVCATDK